MRSDLFSLGIDTSNYKTSVAVVDNNGNVLFNHQEFLEVKHGERGLRQSEALFQHVQKLPEALKNALNNDTIKGKIGSVSVSTRPRPVEGSYMPVFTAGHGYAKTVAAALDVPLFEFTHQEGHIEAIRYYSCLKDKNPIICFHFSGGTTEALLLDDTKGIFKIIGGSKDLSYGQVLDRIGVSLGLDFPCGQALDNIAMMGMGHRNILSKIKVKDGFVNLSGIETQCSKILNDYSQVEILEDLFEKLSASIMEMTMQLSYKYGIDDFIYAGGVSCSRYMRNFLAENIYKDLNIVFGKLEMSSDNAIGIALLGGKKIWL